MGDWEKEGYVSAAGTVRLSPVGMKGKRKCWAGAGQRGKKDDSLEAEVDSANAFMRDAGEAALACLVDSWSLQRRVLPSRKTAMLPRTRDVNLINGEVFRREARCCAMYGLGWGGLIT